MTLAPSAELERQFAFINDIQDVTLSNGIRVLLLPRPQIPSVAIGCQLRAGATLDPAGQEGLANFAARGIGEGTPSRTKEELDEAIDFVGGTYRFSAGMENASGGMQFLKQHLPLAIELLADTLQHPLFPGEEVERGRKQVSGSIRAQLERPGDLCERSFVRAVFAGSAYGHNVDGELETVEGLTRDAIAGFHQTNYAPGNLLLSFAGDFAPAQLLQELESHFGGWSTPTPAATRPTIPVAPASISTELIDRPIQQANIRLGWATINRTHEDYYPTLLMNYILGGASLASRITVTVRDNQGLAYQVVSRFSALEHTGLFSVILQTSNATANQALAGVRDEMRRIMDAEVTDLELDDARSYFSDRFPLTIETNGSMAGQLLHIAHFGFPLTHFREHLENITSVTRADILRAAQTYLQPDAFVLVAVGNQSEAQIAF